MTTDEKRAALEANGYQVRIIRITETKAQVEIYTPDGAKYEYYSPYTLDGKPLTPDIVDKDIQRIVDKAYERMQEWEQLETLRELIETFKADSRVIHNTQLSEVFHNSGLPMGTYFYDWLPTYLDSLYAKIADYEAFVLSVEATTARPHLSQMATELIKQHNITVADESDDDE